MHTLPIYTMGHTFVGVEGDGISGGRGGNGCGEGGGGGGKGGGGGVNGGSVGGGGAMTKGTRAPALTSTGAAETAVYPIAVERSASDCATSDEADAAIAAPSGLALLPKGPARSGMLRVTRRRTLAGERVALIRHAGSKQCVSARSLCWRRWKSDVLNDAISSASASENETTVEGTLRIFAPPVRGVNGG